METQRKVVMSKVSKSQYFIDIKWKIKSCTSSRNLKRFEGVRKIRTPTGSEIREGQEHVTGGRNGYKLSGGETRSRNGTRRREVQ